MIIESAPKTLPPAPQGVPAQPAWRHAMTPDPVLRLSALDDHGTLALAADAERH